jgi:Flp pilus assembly protein TadG
MIRRHRCSTRRKGTIVVLTLFLLTAVIAIAALAIEVGIMSAAKNETQRSADAACLAALWEYQESLEEGATQEEAVDAARAAAVQFGSANQVYGISPTLNLNSSNSPDGDLVFGNISSFSSSSSTFTPNVDAPNALKVVVRRNDVRNGEIRLCFARLLGIDSKPFESFSVGAVASEIKGFRITNGRPISVLPFVLKQPEWNKLLNGIGSDNFTVDPMTGEVSTGSDGIPETNLFPQVTGSAGNSGTIDIGNPGNSTADLVRQITEGLSEEDLAYHGGLLEIGPNGLNLNGDTGISAGMKSALETIIGRGSVIGIYSTVTGNGNNANFNVVKWAGIRVLEVDLTGSKKVSKRITIQPSMVVIDNVIVAVPPSTTDYSDRIIVSPALVK